MKSVFAIITSLFIFSTVQADSLANPDTLESYAVLISKSRNGIVIENPATTTYGVTRTYQKQGTTSSYGVTRSYHWSDMSKSELYRNQQTYRDMGNSSFWNSGQIYGVRSQSPTTYQRREDVVEEKEIDTDHAPKKILSRERLRQENLRCYMNLQTQIGRVRDLFQTSRMQKAIIFFRSEATKPERFPKDGYINIFLNSTTCLPVRLQ